MRNLLPALLPLLWFPTAYAEEAEQPIEGSTTGIVVFIIAFIVCAVLFGWYMWKNEKKSDKEKMGDQF